MLHAASMELDRDVRATQEAVEAQRDLRAWIREMSESSGHAFSKMAAEIAVDESTITRFMNDPKTKIVLSFVTIRKLAKRYRSLPPVDVGPGMEGRIYYLPDVTQIDAEQGITLTKDQTLWRLKSNVLQIAGYMPGDTLLVDHSIDPGAGSAVLASDHTSAKPCTVFRIFRSPFLISASPSAGIPEPLLIGKMAKVTGVIVKVWRFPEGPQ